MGKEKIKILLVEDDLNLGYVVSDNLEQRGFKVILHTNGQTAFQAVFQENFDVGVFDVMLPKKDGFSLTEEIRKEGKNLPVIFLTAKSMEQDRIKGFKSGGDDYLTKPFSMEELVLRIEAIYRRTRGVAEKPESAEFAIGKFIFNPVNFTLSSENSSKTLTAKESGILKVLCDHFNEVVKRETLLKIVWGSDDYFHGRSMDVFITKLRKCLQKDPSVKIINVHGVGFKLTVE
jgi:two-component system, OmpR family, response regulator